MVKKRDIEVNTSLNLIEVIPEKNVAVFQNVTKPEEKVMTEVGVQTVGFIGHFSLGVFEQHTSVTVSPAARIYKFYALRKTVTEASYSSRASFRMNE